MFARRTGHDFSRYRRSTIQRRITWRAQVNKMENFADYFTFLRENVEEVQAIFADPLISVTTFFRDLKAFDALAGEVVPKLFEGRGLTILSASGCRDVRRTSEEDYSIVILLLEEASTYDVHPEL